MKKVDNEKLAVEWEVEDSLTQGMYERFEARLNADKSEGTGKKTLHGKYLRAAIAIGWVKSGPAMNDDQIANQKPQVIALIGQYLVNEYLEASKIPN
jgi:hypothetical protein